MDDGDSISSWIDKVRNRDEQAIDKIWTEYFPRLVALARANLRNRGRSHSDEEDVALSALKSFVIRVSKFPQLGDRDDIWKLLMTITLRKCFHAKRKSMKYSADDAQAWLLELPDKSPTAEEAMLATDELERVLNLLPDDRARKILEIRLEGATNAEIAKRVGCAVATVERKLKIARDILRNEAQ